MNGLARQLALIGGAVLTGAQMLGLLTIGLVTLQQADFALSTTALAVAILNLASVATWLFYAQQWEVLAEVKEPINTNQGLSWRADEYLHSYNIDGGVKFGEFQPVLLARFYLTDLNAWHGFGPVGGDFQFIEGMNND